MLINAKTPVFQVNDATWLWPELKLELEENGRIEISGGFSAADKKVLRKRTPMPVSKWAERHRVVTMTSLPGPWRNSVTPYLAGIMDAAFYPGIQQTILVAAPQTGKSEAINNCVGYAIDRDPGPVLYVYPDELTARDNCRDRIQPMIESSPRLKSYLTGVGNDLSMQRINLQHMPIYMGWARSAARLANRPIRYVIFDETDKYPETSGKREADPISLGEKRTQTYKWNRRIFKISTPTVESGPIWQAFTNEAQAKFDWRVVCPECRKEHLMEFDQIKFPKDERNPEKIETEKLAWYECPHCRAKWDDEKRNRAVRMGCWRERESKLELFEHLKKFVISKIGFHLPAWLSIFVSLSECAASFLKGQQDKNKLKDFLNNYKAEIWKDYSADRSSEEIIKLCDERPRGLVPGGDIIAGMTAAADTQDDGFYYEIRAWGYGLEEESWQIREGFLPTFNALEQVCWSDTYQDSEGREYFVDLLVIDAMGHRTAEVYEWCRLHRGKVYPFKGERTMNTPFAYSKIDTYPSSKKRIPGGLTLLRANVNFYKNKLSSKLEVSGADPGAWHMHSELNKDWVEQMAVEYIDPKTGYWECPEGKANHAWDVSVYQMVAADVRGIRFWDRPEGQTVTKTNRKKKRPARAKRW